MSFYKHLSGSYRGLEWSKYSSCKPSVSVEFDPKSWNFHPLQEDIATLLSRWRSYTPYSTFNPTRLRSATSCDISPSPGPLITTSTTNSCILKCRRNHRNHSNLAHIKYVSDLHRTTTAILIWLCARWILALLRTNLHYLLITSINAKLTYL